MAVVSSHTLDSVLGTHAGAIAVELFRLEPSGARISVFRAATDAGGRLSEEVTPEPSHCGHTYELVFDTGAYFAGHSAGDLGNRVVEQIVVRFRMPDPQGKYHIPLMLSPNSYAVWWSG